MKKIILFFCCFTAAVANAQNVGINTPTPTQPLDVNGNVNVGGNVLVNNIAGTPGQVLSTTSGGSTAWANLGGYTKVANFTSSGGWIVPAGVTKIFLEVWGAGGGGAPGGGGSAGVYSSAYLDVALGQTVSMTLGTGGAGSSTTASDGGNTTVTNSSWTITSLGGRGAGINYPGYCPKFGFSGSNVNQVVGQSGGVTKTTYMQKNATTFVEITEYGYGGASGPNYNMTSQGAITAETSTGTSVYINYTAALAAAPGGGGPGSLPGIKGANGAVLIWYSN